MITCDKDGQILITNDQTSYNLADVDQYTEFLLWVTSPNRAACIDADAFEIDESISGSQLEKAKRYSSFLSSFAAKRMSLLDSSGSQEVGEQRLAEIRSLLGKLGNK